VLKVMKILAFAALVELGTGLALIAVPVVVVTLLLGSTLSSEGIPVARVAGVALLALGLACWPTPANAASNRSAIQGLLLYNAVLPVYLARLALVKHTGGVLLWPAVVGHAGIALLLVWMWVRGGARTRRS
jgi:hypothetical protein